MFRIRIEVWNERTFFSESVIFMITMVLFGDVFIVSLGGPLGMRSMDFH